MFILIIFLFVYIGYRFEDIYWVDVNIIYYSDILKKGIINLKIFDNDREKFDILKNYNLNIKFYDVYLYVLYSLLNIYVNDILI